MKLQIGQLVRLSPNLFQLSRRSHLGVSTGVLAVIIQQPNETGFTVAALEPISGGLNNPVFIHFERLPSYSIEIIGSLGPSVTKWPKEILDVVMPFLSNSINQRRAWLALTKPDVKEDSKKELFWKYLVSNQNNRVNKVKIRPVVDVTPLSRAQLRRARRLKRVYWETNPRSSFGSFDGIYLDLFSLVFLYQYASFVYGERKARLSPKVWPEAPRCSLFHYFEGDVEDMPNEVNSMNFDARFPRNGEGPLITELLDRFHVPARQIPTLIAVSGRGMGTRLLETLKGQKLSPKVVRKVENTTFLGGFGGVPTEEMLSLFAIWQNKRRLHYDNGVVGNSLFERSFITKLTSLWSKSYFVAVVPDSIIKALSLAPAKGFYNEFKKAFGTRTHYLYDSSHSKSRRFRLINTKRG